MLKKAQLILALCLLTIGVNGQSINQGVTQPTLQYPGKVFMGKKGYDSWGLKKTEWKKYTDLMKGKSGLFYGNADPYYVLAVYESNRNKKKEYAKRSLKLQEERHRQDLAMFLINKELTDAMSPKEAKEEPLSQSPLQPPQRQASLSPLYRTALFIKTNCAKCDTEAKKLAAQGGVDIYIADATNDEQIRQWATGQNISNAKVQTRQITLNYGEDLATQLNIQAYPAAFKTDGRRYEPLSY